MPEDPIHTRAAPGSDVCLPQCVVIHPTKFREEYVTAPLLLQFLNSVLEREDKSTYSIKANY